MNFVWAIFVWGLSIPLIGAATASAQPAEGNAESDLGRLALPETLTARWWQKDLWIWMEADQRTRNWRSLAPFSLAFDQALEPSNAQSMREVQRLRAVGLRVLDYVTVYHHPEARLRVAEGWWETDHPNWFVVDAEGRTHRSTFREYRSGSFQTCVNHPGFVADVLGRVADVIEAGADGIFVDHVTAMNRCFGPETSKHPHRVARTSPQQVRIPLGSIEQRTAMRNDREYDDRERQSDPTANTALTRLLGDMRRVMHEVNPEAILVINPVDVTTVPPEIWAIVDMVMFESFMTPVATDANHSKTIQPLPWNVWHDALAQCMPFLQQGKRVLAYSSFDRSPDEQRKDTSFYAFCTAKLFHAIWGKTFEADLREIFAINLGRPRLDRPLVRAGVYYREYENGLVLVNPSEEPKKFSWPTPEGAKVFDHYAGREIESGKDFVVEVPAESGRLFEYRSDEKRGN